MTNKFRVLVIAALVAMSLYACAPMQQEQIAGAPGRVIPVDNGLHVAVPTSIATAVPALVVDTKGGQSNLVEYRVNATPVYQMNKSGDEVLLSDTTITAGDGIEWELVTSHTTGDTEAMRLDFNQVDNAVDTDDAVVLKIEAVSESGDAGDTLRGISMVYEEGTANTIMDAGIAIDNAETTAATMTDAIIVTSSGVANGVTDAVDVSATNIANAINIGANPILGGDETLILGTPDDALTITRNDSGSVTFTCADDDANAECIYDSGGTGNVQVGTADTTSVNVRGAAVDVDVTGAVSIDGDAASNVSVAGAGIDLTLASAAGRVVVQGSEAAVDAVLLDADADAVSGITMATGATSGYALTGGPFDLDVTGAVSLDADLASNWNTAAGDITLEAEVGSVVLKGDEAVADAVYIDANDAAGTGVTIDVGATTGLIISGGVTNIGNGTPVDAAGDNDLFVTADMEVDGTAYFDGAVDMDSTLDVAGAVALASDVTLAADSTGGNLGAKNEFIGLPRIKLMGVGTGTNPASQTISLFDDDPTGEWAAVDGSTVLSLSTDPVKYGTNSLKIAWNADAVATDGFLDAGLGAAAAWDDMESCGLLVQSDTAWASGDLTLVLTDDGGARTFSIPALTEVNKWTWLEVDISTGDLSAISDVAILMSAQGEAALGAFNMYIDIGYVWDIDDEEALDVAIQQDGVLGVVDPADGTNLAELTNYIVHYESGVDFLVWITDESAAYPMVMVAY